VSSAVISPERHLSREVYVYVYHALSVTNRYRLIDWRLTARQHRKVNVRRSAQAAMDGQRETMQNYSIYLFYYDIVLETQTKVHRIRTITWDSGESVSKNDFISDGVKAKAPKAKATAKAKAVVHKAKDKVINRNQGLRQGHDEPTQYHFL